MINISKIRKSFFNNKLAKDSFWALIGNVSSRGLGLLAAIVVARYLGKDIFGEYGMIRNTIISLAMFSTFGLGYTATKFVAEYKNSNLNRLKIFCKYAVLMTLVVSGMMSILLFIFSSYIANVILEAPHLNIPLKFVAVWIVFNALTTTQIGVLSGLGEFKKMARINTIVGVVSFILSVILTYFFGLNGALLALLLSQLLNWYLYYVIVNKNISKESIGKKETVLLKEIISFSFPIASQEALSSITSWISCLLLIKLTTYGQLGIYTVAMQWSAVILFIPGILRNVILSHMSEVCQDSSKHKKILDQMLWINFICTLIPFIIILIFSEYIASLYGSTFKGLKKTLSIAIFMTIFMSMSNVYIQAYMSKSKNWLLLLFSLPKDLGIIFLTFILIKKNEVVEGANVLVYSTLIMNIVFFVIVALYYKLKFENTV